MVKVGTADNPADVLTKNLNAETMGKHMKAMQCRTDAGRAGKAPQLNEMIKLDDYLEITSPEGGEWKRRHVKTRASLFTTMRVVGRPRNGLAVVEIRATVGQYVRGNAFMRLDLCKEMTDAHSLRPEPLTRYTMFMIAEEYNERF